MEPGICAPVCQVCRAALLEPGACLVKKIREVVPKSHSPWLTPHPLMKCRGPSDLWTLATQD